MLLFESNHDDVTRVVLSSTEQLYAQLRSRVGCDIVKELVDVAVEINIILESAKKNNEKRVIVVRDNCVDGFPFTAIVVCGELTANGYRVYKKWLYMPDRQQCTCVYEYAKLLEY